VSILDTRAIGVDELPREPFPEVDHEFRVFISETAFDQLAARGDADPSREVGGVLVGEVLRDAGGPYVRVDTTIDAVHAGETQTELTFTHSTWEHIHKEMDARHESKRIVGWYHTHPGFGIFLSDQDLFIQRSFFNLPFHIAMVYDPKRREHGVFAWRDNAPTRCRRYWIGRNEHVWEGPLADTNPPPRKGESRDSEPDREQEKEERKGLGRFELDPYTLAIAALVILVIGGLVGWWLGRSAISQVIRDAEAKLMEARLAGAQETTRVLNADVLGVLRQALGERALREPLDEGLASLDQGLQALGKDDRDGARRHLLEGRAKIRAIRDRYGRADATLATLERIARTGPIDPRKMAHVLSNNQAALGQLYEEIAAQAAKAGDTQRALRLLQAAKGVNPRSAQRYEQMREAIMKKEPVR